MKRFIVKGVTMAVLAAALVFPPATSAFAASLAAQGQPNQTCGQNGANRFPGNASSSPGSPFNEPSATSPGGQAGSVYAGNGVSADHANSDHAVSQYDVACSK